MKTKDKISLLYKKPKYYEIAFSFRNIKKEVDFIEGCIKKFSKIKVRNVIELACGNSPHMIELVKRGYNFTGLDNSKYMLDYSKEKAKRNGVKITTIQADMNNFRINKKFDLAYVMLGSIFVKSNEEFFSHLDCVAKCLRKGGLYLIDGMINFYWNDILRKDNIWTIEKDGVKVKTTWIYSGPVDLVNQTCIENSRLEVINKGKKIVLKDKSTRKIFFPQEFISLIELHNKFDFLGWYPDFTFRELKIRKGQMPRVTVILRKK